MHIVIRRKQGPDGLMTIKLDMSKAYNRVEWDFLRWMMEELGFTHTWVNLVMRYVTGFSYSILLNGKQMGFFKPTDKNILYLLICSYMLGGVVLFNTKNNF